MKILQALVRKLLSLRYNVEIQWADLLTEKDQQILLFPNHVALIDPVIIYAFFSKYLWFKVLATNNFANNKLLKPIFKAIWAIGIDDLETEKKDTNTEQVQSSIETTLQVIRNKENLLLYPSWGLAWQGYEAIGSKRSAFLVTQETLNNAKCKILLVHIEGLWGSIRSNARSEKGSNFAKTFFKGFFILIANLIFFLPKRKVKIEIKDFTEELKLLAKKDIKEFNQALENFYNRKGEEKVSYVPHYFFYNDVKNKTLPKNTENSVEELKKINTYHPNELDPDIQKSIITMIYQIREDSKELEIWVNTHFIFDLMFDSLDMAELKNLVQAKYPQAGDLPILRIKTLGDLVAMAMGKLGKDESSLAPCEWNFLEKEKKIENWSLNEKKTIPQLFKDRVKQNKKSTFSYDALFGLQSRNDFAIKSFLLRNKLKSLGDENHVGVMLPALNSTGLVIMGLYLSNKVPVMMNRTLPQQAFEHCVRFSKIKVILTSKKFYETLNIDRLKKYHFIFLEDLLKKVSLKDKLKALTASIKFTIPKQKNNDSAVILFTSGSEALPKAVSLSHYNIISDIKGALVHLNMTDQEILFWFLPPFHSFGFTVNTILPLITWVRLVNTPDPNDSLTTGKLIAHTKATMITTTPTFLKNLINANTTEKIWSLKTIISGAEKCPDELFKNLKEKLPKAQLIEGYGITECSPVISLNPSKKTKAKSVGLAIKGGELIIIDLESKKPVANGQEGMICYRGPNVFDGYLDPKLDSPFIEIAGEKWYETGDLGYLDTDNYLYITGRLKRFIKIWGEMVSLPFIEELLLEKRGKEETRNLAVEAEEQNGEVKIVVFTVETPLSTKEINSYLKSQGVSNLIRIDEVKEIWAIPILGTGKTDYKVLKKMI